MTVTVQQWDDPPSWNAFVATTPYAHFHQSWEWGDLAPESGGHTFRLAAVRAGAVAGTMQIILNPVSHTGSEYLYVPRGPAVTEPAIEVLGPLLDRARLLGYQERAVGIRLEPPAPPSDYRWSTTLKRLGLDPSHPPSQPRSSWVLNLDGDEDQLLAGMKQKTRYNIRLAAKKGVEVIQGSVADIDVFFDIYQETALRDDFLVLDKRVYRRMFELFDQSDDFRLLLARYQGEVVAAITLVRMGGTCWYLHGASSNRHRNVMATYLIQWEGIRQARRWGCTLYDFRGVPDILREGQDMYGVYRFKEGFGGFHFTASPTYTAAYRPIMFAGWQLVFRGRFALDTWQRRRKGLPIRQFA